VRVQYVFQDGGDQCPGRKSTRNLFSCVCFYLIDLCVFCFPTHIVGGQKQKQNQMEGGIRQGDPQTWPFRIELPSIHPSQAWTIPEKNSSTGNRRGNNVKCSGGSDLSKFLCLFRIDLVFPMSDNQLK
jgi:hypothetical protein